MNRILSVCIAAMVGALAVPAIASAGTYHVYTCSTNGGLYGPNAWTSRAATGLTADMACFNGGNIRSYVAAGATTPDNVYGGITFTAPAGTTIADFALSRELNYVGTANAGTHAYYTTFQATSTAPAATTVFAGAGDYADATRNALNAQGLWYGYPASTINIGRSTVTPAMFPALAPYVGKLTSLSLFVGCYSRGTPCSLPPSTPAGAITISNALYGSDVTISDPVPPTVTIEASGLLAGGPRDGADPVSVTASDSTGIRSIDLFDVTSGTPLPVGGEDYSATGTDNNRKCDFSRTAPCPTSLARELVRASVLPAGERQLLIRVTDTGGNVVERGPFPVNAVTPSNRGDWNGTGATDTGTMLMSFARSKSRRRTVSYGKHVLIGGRLLNSGGSPIAGAQVAVLTRDLRQGAPTVVRKLLTTRADGSVSYTAKAGASRQIQFGWRSHGNDTRYAASGYLTLRARASARLGVSTKRPRVGRSMTIKGTMNGVSRSGVTVVVQGRAYGAKRWETFADTTASRTGRFSARYRFRSAASRGHRFVFRARIVPGTKAPYSTGYSNRVTVRVR